MLLRIIHYLTALVALSAMSMVYQNLVTPWMTPPKIERIEMGQRGPAQPDRSLHSLFRSGTWQRGQCRQLQTKDMTLLFQELEQESEDRLRLSPVTVILGHGMSGKRDPNPVIIEAVEGAEITFSSGLNLLSSSGGAPPIESGRIQGPVHIYRTASEEDQPFDIHTSNVGIRNRKIWTTDRIDLKVGGARCVGSDLTIHLANPASAGRQSGDALLDRIELIYLDELTVPLPASDSTANNSDASASKSSVLSINCDGRLEYDFAIDQLELHDAVSFVHQAPSMPADEFRCDLLNVKFRDPTNTKLQRAGPLDWLVEIVATGSPASVKAPSFDAEMFADKIEFHAIKGLIHAHGKDGVQIRRGGITARLANLVYQFDTQHPKTVGAIDVQGAGIVQVRDPKIPLRRLQWRDGFKMFPVSATTAEVLDSKFELQVDGDFHAWLTDGGEIQANSIAGILKPELNPTSGTTTLVPERLKINENVRIETAAVSATTQQLYVEFVAEQNPQVDPTDPQPARSLRQWVTQPSGDQPLTAPIARQRPVITGDAINVQLRRNDTGMSVKRLSIAGSVIANHQLETGGQTLPAKFTGELLQLVDGGGDDVLQITGAADTPARFDFGDGFFIGPRIQIRPRDNYVWINEAGEFRIPTAALPAGLPDQPGTKMQWTRPPHCRWNGEMRFDGRTALLTGGIRITAAMINNREPWEIEMSGDRLQVDLVEGVEVRDVSTMRSASVRAVSLMQASDRPVVVRAIQHAADGTGESKHMLQASKLILSPAAGGGLVGEGPGWYRGWFVPQSNRGIIGNATETKNVDEASNLTGVHLVFGDSMRGDMATRTLDFVKGVRVGIRPVADWDESFDAVAMDSISIGESTLDCDQLRFAIDPGFVTSSRTSRIPVPWEVEALRGVVFRTRNDRGLIEGTAARAAYASSKQLFTADGGPNRPSVVRQTRADGSNGLNLRNRTITINLGTMTIVNQELEGFNFPAQ